MATAVLQNGVARSIPATRRGQVDEHYEALVRRLQVIGDGWSSVPHALGITGCAASQGVSTVAANLAMAAANVSRGRVLLVDANVARPAVGKAFRAKSETGLLNVLGGERPASDGVCESSVTNLALMLPGRLPQGCAPAYDTSSTNELIEELKNEFQYIVFDLPPASELTTCFSFAGRLDGMLLVIEAQRVHQQDARRAREQLDATGANVLGVVLNKT